MGGQWQPNSPLTLVRPCERLMSFLFFHNKFVQERLPVLRSTFSPFRNQINVLDQGNKKNPKKASVKGVGGLV